MKPNPTKAAIKLANGKVFVGNCHGDALDRAAVAGYCDQVLDNAQLGFPHSDGTAFYQAPLTLLVEGVES
jgi:hypothetical protein